MLGLILLSLLPLSCLGCGGGGTTLPGLGGLPGLGSIDPLTGLPIDPLTGLPIDIGSLPIDPATGLPINPLTGLPFRPPGVQPIDPGALPGGRFVTPGPVGAIITPDGSAPDVTTKPPTEAPEPTTTSPPPTLEPESTSTTPAIVETTTTEPIISTTTEPPIPTEPPTDPPPPPTTAAPITSPVQSVDARSPCCIWAAQGDCDTNPLFMKYVCKTECGITKACKPQFLTVSGQGCDTKVHEACGSAPVPTPVGPTQPGPGAAVNNLPGFIAASPSPASAPQVIVAYILEQTQGSGAAACVDTDPQCEAWADDGECDKNPFWMKPNCAASCDCCGGTCKIGEPVVGGCGTDMDASCPFWASIGECERNKVWMIPNCAPSCGCKNEATNSFSRLGRNSNNIIILTVDSMKKRRRKMRLAAKRAAVRRTRVRLQRLKARKRKIQKQRRKAQKNKRKDKKKAQRT